MLVKSSCLELCSIYGQFFFFPLFEIGLWMTLNSAGPSNYRDEIKLMRCMRTIKWLSFGPVTQCIIAQQFSKTLAQRDQQNSPSLSAHAQASSILAQAKIELGIHGVLFII